MMSASDLRTLRDRPFELLLELERRSRAVIAGKSRDSVTSQDWTGVGFRIGSEKFLAAREEIREVLPLPESPTRVPGSKSWVTGLANVRGQLLAIVDLRAFLGAGAVTESRFSRVLAVHHRELPVGFVVDEVYGFRRFSAKEFSETVPPTIIRCESFLVGCYKRGQESWPVFDLAKLLQNPAFLQVAA